MAAPAPLPGVIGPDGKFTPPVMAALGEYLRPLLGQAFQEVQRKSALVPILPAHGSVKTVDAVKGECTIVVDGDDDSNQATATMVGGAQPTAGDRVMLLFTEDGRHWALGHIGHARNQQVAAVLMVGGPGGVGTTAYLGNVALWNDEQWAAAFTSDGRTIFNHKNNGGSTEFREENLAGGTAALLKMFLAGGTVNMTTPQALPVLSGGLGMTYVVASNQIGHVSSSDRFKEAFRAPDEDRLVEATLALEPVRFRFRDHEGVIDHEAHTRERIGLRAEQVAEVFPEAAILGPDPDEPPARYEDGWEPPKHDPEARHPADLLRVPLTLDTLRLPPVVHGVDDPTLIAGLVAVCRRQQRQIDALTAKVEALEGGPDVASVGA